MAVVVMACKCGDAARYEHKTSDLVENLAWHLEEAGWLVVLELGLAFVWYISVESSSWLCYGVMGEEIGMSVGFVALGWPMSLNFFAHHARVE